MLQGEKEDITRQQVVTEFYSDVASAVGVKSENLYRPIKGAEAFLFKDQRYCCLINGDLNQESGIPVEIGFVKITKSGKPDLVRNLGRESFIAQHAQELGIPAVKCLTPITPVKDKYFLIQLEALSPKDGIAYMGKEMHASAPVEVAAQATGAILSLYQKTIPGGLDTSMLERQHERNADSESFSTVWQDENEKVFGSDNSEIVAHLCQTTPDKKDGISNLHQIIDTAQRYLETLIPAGQDDTHEFLSHGDADLNNMFFKHNGEVVLIDWETAAVTHNWFLAQLTDLSNLYGRCWVDPEKQKQILSSIVKSDCFDDLETRYRVAYSVAVFGSMYLAKFAMDPNHHEHPMTQSLLGNLQGNLDHLNAEYQSLGQS